MRYSESDMEYEEGKDKEDDGFTKVTLRLSLTFVAVAVVLIVLLVLR